MSSKVFIRAIYPTVTFSHAMERSYTIIPNRIKYVSVNKGIKHPKGWHLQFFDTKTMKRESIPLENILEWTELSDYKHENERKTWHFSS
jgi:hypothetical protein